MRRRQILKDVYSYHIILYCWAEGGGQYSTELKILASQLAAPGLIPSIPKKNSEEKLSMLLRLNQWRWLEESGQWLENVALSQIALASGKPVLQK